MCFKTWYCAICGLTKLNHQHKHFKKLNSMYNNLNTNEFECTLYGIVNCLLSNYTTISNGKDMCVCVCVCVCVFKMLYWMWCTDICRIYFFQSPTYMKTLLSELPFYIQLLSF